MNLDTFENGIMAHNEKIFNKICTDGIYVMHEVSYSYTVGMKKIGAPELICYDIRRTEIEEIFMVIFQAVQLQLLANLDEQSVLNDILEPGATLHGVTELEKRRLFYADRTHYGNWNFRAMQIKIEVI